MGMTSCSTGTKGRFKASRLEFEIVATAGDTSKIKIRGRRDTVVVPSKGGSVVLRSRFLDYTGVFMMHCHMMNHEDLGMMQTIEVYKD